METWRLDVVCMRIKWHNDCEGEIHKHHQTEFPLLCLRAEKCSLFIYLEKWWKSLEMGTLGNHAFHIEKTKNFWGYHWCLFWVSGCVCRSSRWEFWQNTWLSHTGGKQVRRQCACVSRQACAHLCSLKRNNAPSPWAMLWCFFLHMFYWAVLTLKRKAEPGGLL